MNLVCSFLVSSLHHYLILSCYYIYIHKESWETHLVHPHLHECHDDIQPAKSAIRNVNLLYRQIETYFPSLRSDFVNLTSHDGIVWFAFSPQRSDNRLFERITLWFFFRRMEHLLLAICKGRAIRYVDCIRYKRVHFIEGGWKIFLFLWKLGGRWVFGRKRLFGWQFDRIHSIEFEGMDCLRLFMKMETAQITYTVSNETFVDS